MNTLEGNNGCTFSTSYKVGDKVWVLQVKKRIPREREIVGVRTQLINGVLTISYSFKTDQSLKCEVEDKMSYFWVYQKYCFKSRSELEDNLWLH